jgi:hypothetical protein
MTTARSLKRCACGVITTALVLSGGAVSAHHSYAMFNQTRTATVAGTVRQFEWKMPHAILWLNATDEKGAEVV